MQKIQTFQCQQPPLVTHAMRTHSLPNMGIHVFIYEHHISPSDIIHGTQFGIVDKYDFDELDGTVNYFVNRSCSRCLAHQSSWSEAADEFIIGISSGKAFMRVGRTFLPYFFWVGVRLPHLHRQQTTLMQIIRTTAHALLPTTIANVCVTAPQKNINKLF